MCTCEWEYLTCLEFQPKRMWHNADQWMYWGRFPRWWGRSRNYHLIKEITHCEPVRFNKSETVFKQQLKNAVYQNSRTPIRQFIEKHDPVSYFRITGVCEFCYTCRKSLQSEEKARWCESNDGECKLCNVSSWMRPPERIGYSGLRAGVSHIRPVDQKRPARRFDPIKDNLKDKNALKT